MDMPQVNGILETSLYVENLEISMAFYKTIFGFETLYSDHRFCALGISQGQVLLLFIQGASVDGSEGPGGTIPPHDGNGNLHLAFSIAKNELASWKKWLEDNAVEIESEYQWERGGTSLYFRDPDNHALELATPGLWRIY